MTSPPPPPPDPDKSIWMALIFGIAALLLHYYEMVSGLILEWNNVFIVYVSFALFLALGVYFSTTDHESGDFFKTLGHYFLLTIIAGVIVPQVLKYVVENFFDPGLVRNGAYFALWVFPPLFFALVFDVGVGFSDGWRHLLSFYVAGWFVIFVIIGASSLVIDLPNDYERADTVTGFWETLDEVGEGLVDFTDRFWGGLNETLNPRILDPDYYTGRVEDTEDVDLGVQLEDLGPTENYYTPRSEPVVSAYITADTLLGSSINVRPACHSTEGDGIPGFVDKPQVEVLRSSEPLVSCRFPSGLEAGNYDVEMSASFDFETWADVTYQFVHRDKLLEFVELDRDIRAELNIDAEPEAISSGGPVLIGMGGSSRMPVAVINEAPYLQDATIGFTIVNRWPKGEIGDVYEMSLKVPEGFELLECDRREGEVYGPQADPNVAGYEQYVFTNTYDPTTPFTTVRCDLGLSGPEVLGELQGDLDTVPRTFIATANYEYTVTEKTRFEVTE